MASSLIQKLILAHLRSYFKVVPQKISSERWIFNTVRKTDFDTIWNAVMAYAGKGKEKPEIYPRTDDQDDGTIMFDLKGKTTSAFLSITYGNKDVSVFMR